MFGEIQITDWIMLFTRWAHAIGAVAWIGGSVFFAFVLRPLAHANPDLMRPVLRNIGGIYRELVDISVIVILVSGIILMFNRLTGDDASPSWFIVLGVKLVIAAWMFYLVWNFRQSDFNPNASPTGFASKITWLVGYNAMVFLGVIVFLLAGLMKVLFETTIGG
ncbi:MAG: urate hydroxylase PuuD [Dehalococcoidia bacterium]